MSRIWSMMDVGKRSMMNSQTALQTVSHNIANKETEGFSRQRVELKANSPTGLGNLRVGTGARTSGVTRINNSYLEKQIENAGAGLGTTEARASSLGRVEQVFNEQVNKGLNKYLGEFFNSFRELSNNPESLASRTLVKESADFLTRDFHRVDKALKEIQDDVDYQIATHVTEVNSMTREISQLNEKVQSIEIQGITANDERDRRDQLIKDLGKLVNIRYAEGDSGSLTITAGNTAVLVSGHESRELVAKSTAEGKNKREGNFEIFYKSTDKSTPVNVTRQITGGKVGGLLDVRDNTVNDLIGKVDDMAYTVAKEVNKAHVHGVDRYNGKGQLFFQVPTEAKGAAQNIKVNNVILEDVGMVAAGASKNAPGDNRIANIISSLQYKNTMGDGSSTIDDHYNTIVGEVGIKASRANSYTESQKGIVKQLKNIRESISGVSLDEETTKMIEYQKSFDASARLIRTADEMMDTVLNLKRV